jgi:hypothetical protein
METIDVLLDPRRSRDGLFPELVIFDCHACHHPMSDLRWSPRTQTSPGRIRLNDANLLMLRQIARRTLAPEEASAFAQQVSSLHRAVSGDGGDPFETARALRATLEAISARLASRRFSAEDLRAMAAGLVEDGMAEQYRDYAGARTSDNGDRQPARVPGAARGPRGLRHHQRRARPAARDGSG